MKHRDIQNIYYKEIVQSLNQGVNSLDFSKVYLTRGQINDLAERVASNPFVGHIIWGPLPSESKELVEQIENKLIENNKSYKSHPTDFVHGLLSSHSYQNVIEGNKVEFTVDSKGAPHVNVKYNQYLEDWRVEKVWQPLNADDYYSVLYVNDKTHHAVLAHRGTDIPNSIKDLLTLGRGNKSLKADLIEILNHNIGVQQAASYVSTKEALEITQQLGYNFSTTGHSLGAWLAELSLYFCHKDFKYDKVKAVTFDSPGSKEQLDTYEPNVHNAETKGSKNQSNIVIYLSAPNMVNVCNQHIGTVYRLAPEIKYLAVPAFVRELVAKLTPDSIQKRTEQKQYLVEALLSVLVTHSLNPMLDAFNPDTGKPYPDKYSLVLDWPHITHMPSTSHIQTIGTELVLDDLPFAKFAPNFLKKGAIKKLSDLIPNNTASSVTNVIISFLSGDIALAQLLQTFKHFDLNTHHKGYLLKDLSSLEQFSLSYEGHYRTRSVDLSQARLLTKYKGSIDWCLSQVAKTNAAILAKGLDEISYKQLSIIKKGFKIQHIDDKRYISLIDQHQHNIATIEQFKEYFSRLIEVNPAIKSLIENRAEGQMHIEIIQSDVPRKYSEENINPEDDSMEKNDIKQIHTQNLLSAQELYSKACHYDSQGDYKLALQYYQNALLQSEDALPLVKAQRLYSIACKKYDQLNQTELALANYLESLKIYNSENNNHIQIAPISYSIGAKYDELRDNKLALKYYNDALSAYQKLNSLQSSQKVAEILYSIGAKYDDNIDSQKALQYYCKSLKEFCSAKNNTKTIELLSVIEQKCKDLNHLDLGLKCKEQLQILQVAQKLSLSDNIEQKKVATEIQPILEKIGSLTKEGFWNKGFFTSYSTPFYNYGVKGYIDKNYILNQLGPNSNDEDFEIAKILCFEKICIAISENIKSEKSLNCLLEFAKVYPETIKAVQATMFCNPENFPELKVALDLINNELFSVHQDTQMTSPLVLIPMAILFHIDKVTEPNEIIMGKEMCSEENIL